jgi:serine/threonine-protein kinase
VKDIDPVVETAIMRCLQKDAALRPSSVRQVAAAFPGGDPLAAALAAGQTPSPEMVAASGEAGGLRPAVAWAVFAGVTVSITAAILLGAQTKLYRRVPLDKPPEALAERAREIVQNAGYTQQPADTAMGFNEGTDFLRYVADNDKSKSRWDNLETGAFEFWYRGSPRPLEAGSIFGDAPILGGVSTDDPPLTVSGMTLVTLDPLGRLTRFIAVPPQVDRQEAPAPAPDWGLLFSAARLDPSRWTPSQPIWTPPGYGDARAAWTGSLAGHPRVPMRIEAAAYRGKPIYFELIGPWTRPIRMQPYQSTAIRQLSLSFIIVLFLAVVVGSALLTRRNLRLARGDRRGADRLAAFVFLAWGVAWTFGAHHVHDFGELALFVAALVSGIGLSSFTWLLYIALEPYVRRRWPATLVSWSRLVAGNIRDPLVGRDMLIGCLLSSSTYLFERIIWLTPSWFGYPSPQPTSGPTWQFLGALAIVSSLATTFIGAPTFWLSALFVLVIFRNLLRKEWLTAVAFVLLGVLAGPASGQFYLESLVSNTIFGVLAVLVLIRFGLLALATNFVFFQVLETFPLTTSGSAWYSGISLVGIAVMAAIAFYAFHTSLGGAPVFGGAVLEE